VDDSRDCVRVPVELEGHQTLIDFMDKLRMRGEYCREMGGMVYWKHVIESKEMWYIQRNRKDWAVDFEIEREGGERIGA